MQDHQPNEGKTAPGDITLVHETPPEPGQVIEVAPGILWARLSLPFRLNHVNVWLLEENDGWTVIDCGAAGETTEAAWQTLHAGPMGGKPVRGLIGTHGHTDHVGISTWFVEKFDTSLTMTLAEWQSASLRYIRTRERPEQHVLDFYTNHGCDSETLERFASGRQAHGIRIGQQPGRFVRMREGDMLTAGGRKWQVIVGGGHADEHASLYCADDNILIAGDQILQRITPVVGVFPDQPDAHPLRDYLESLPRFAALDNAALVLPSHGLPFYGLRERAQFLINHHIDRLADLSGYLTAELTGYQCAALLFERAVKEGHGVLALAETLAHLHELERTDKANRIISDNGQVLFSPR